MVNRCDNCGAPKTKSLCSYCKVDEPPFDLAKLVEAGCVTPNEVRAANLIPDWELIDTITR